MDAVVTPQAAAADRRRRLAKTIGDGLIVLTAAAAAVKSRDIFYHPYRQDSYLYYLSDCAAPHTALLLAVRGGRVCEELFFCRARDAAAELWDGKRPAPAALAKRLHLQSAADIADFPDILRARAGEFESLYYLPGANGNLDDIVAGIARNRRRRRGGGGITRFFDVAAPLDEMRLVKDKCEIARIRAACDLTCAGVKAAMRAAAKAKNECEVDAAITAVYRAGGGAHAFPPVVAGGKNACTLHYADNNAALNKRLPLLLDTGCEWRGYAGDITRTFPPAGEWSEAAAAVYDIVLRAQTLAIHEAKPGQRWSTVESAGARALVNGLRALGLCRGAAARILKNGSYRRFYPHRIGHSLGLDVHDVGDAPDAAGKAPMLREGMVMTVEPGLYIPAAADIPPAFRGIGARVEDDILITARGHEVLTAAAPRTPRQIERWLR